MDRNIYCEGQVKTILRLEREYIAFQKRFKELNPSDSNGYFKLASKFFDFLPKLLSYPEFFGDFANRDKLQGVLASFLDPDSPEWEERIELEKKSKLEKSLFAPSDSPTPPQVDDIPF